MFYAVRDGSVLSAVGEGPCLGNVRQIRWGNGEEPATREPRGEAREASEGEMGVRMPLIRTWVFYMRSWYCNAAILCGLDVGARARARAFVGADGVGGHEGCCDGVNGPLTASR